MRQGNALQTQLAVQHSRPVRDIESALLPHIEIYCHGYAGRSFLVVQDGEIDFRARCIDFDFSPHSRAWAGAGTTMEERQ